MSIKRIVIIGLGTMGKKHLDFARAHCPSASIKVLTKRQSNENEKKGNRYLKTISEVIDFKPQLIVIANPASLHIEIIIKIAKLDAFILVEKPLSINLANIENLFKAFTNSDLKLLIGYNLRFNPSLCYFREICKKEAIGKIFSVRAEVGQYLPNWRIGKDYKKTVSANKSLGGGVLLELSHELDYLIWIFGRPKWVVASMNKFSNLKVDTEDQAIMIIGHENIFNEKNFEISLNLDFFRHDTTRRCTLIGEKGSVRWDGILGVVERFDTSENRWVEEFCDHNSSNKSYYFEWCHFIDCAQGRDTPKIKVQDGMDVLSLIEAARLSNLKRKQILISYQDVEKFYE
ncbi:MAG: hypothetical protein CL851_05430 [Crocinitomicaceae bacterium]|nr:hypothetical protein [Crocinitomicaceae bacterium]